ncbi:MAG TPA: hypothetical protein VM032_06060 [Vicinamibacterales bacterium]|nr:hypothetical protein [Vicinamibacterales bacterium]
MILLPVLAFVMAIVSVRHHPDPPFLTGNHSPFGYTLSLSLFLVPCVSLAIWFSRQRELLPYQWKAFWMTAGLVATTWSLLDILLGNTFFIFPNRGATLGIMVPGYTFGKGWERTIPIEEFAFYILGSFSILLGYIWAAESWLSRYTLSYDEYRARVTGMPRLVNFRPRPMVAGIALFVVALLWKKFGWHDHHDGFPAYFLFELLMVVLPAATLSDAIMPFVNIPAFVFKTLALVMTSLLWEVTLAMPYGWWNFNHEYMMGVLIRPWFDLPVEEVILWPCAAWVNLVFFETIRLYKLSGRPLMDVLFSGPPAPRAAERPSAVVS